MLTEGCEFRVSIPVCNGRPACNFGARGSSTLNLRIIIDKNRPSIRLMEGSGTGVSTSLNGPRLVSDTCAVIVAMFRPRI